MSEVLVMIRFDYEETIRNANVLRSLSDDIARLSKQLGSMITATNSHWRGPAANAYAKQCLELKDSMMKTSRVMQFVSDTIKQTANERRQETLDWNYQVAGYLREINDKTS